MSTKLYALSVRTVTSRGLRGQRELTVLRADVEVRLDDAQVRRLAEKAVRNRSRSARCGALTAKVIRGTFKEGD